MDKSIQEQLILLLNNSYSPYSNFKVSSIVVSSDGATFGGVNVENSSYGVSICAERNAASNMIASGRRAIKTVYVAWYNNINVYLVLTIRSLLAGHVFSFCPR